MLSTFQGCDIPIDTARITITRKSVMESVDQKYFAMYCERSIGEFLPKLYSNFAKEGQQSISMWDPCFSTTVHLEKGEFST